MIYALAAASFVVFACLASLRRALPPEPHRSFRPILITNAYDFAAPFTATVWAYATFSLFLSWQLNPQSVDIGLLAKAERMGSDLQAVISLVKVPKVVFLTLLAVLFVCCLVAIRTDAIGGMARELSPKLARLAALLARARSYNKTLSTAVAGLTAATLFTFFGPIPGNPQTDLQAHLKEFNQVLGRFEQELDQVIREDFARELVERAFDAMPKPYRASLEWYLDQAASVRGRMRATPPHDFVLNSNRVLKSLDLSERSRSERIDESSAGKQREIVSAFDAAVMPSLSIEALQNMEQLLRNSGHPRASHLAALEAGRQLVQESLFFIFDTSGAVDMQRLERLHPALKPIGEVITDSVDDVVKAKLKEAALSIRRRILSEGRAFSWSTRTDLAKQAIETSVALPAQQPSTKAIAQATSAIVERSAVLAAEEKAYEEKRERESKSKLGDSVFQPKLPVIAIPPIIRTPPRPPPRPRPPPGPRPR